jgi:DICT domain-containing protein
MLIIVVLEERYASVLEARVKRPNDLQRKGEAIRTAERCAQRFSAHLGLQRKQPANCRSVQFGSER